MNGRVRLQRGFLGAFLGFNENTNLGADDPLVNLEYIPPRLRVRVEEAIRQDALVLGAQGGPHGPKIRKGAALELLPLPAKDGQRLVVRLHDTHYRHLPALIFPGGAARGLPGDSGFLLEVDNRRDVASHGRLRRADGALGPVLSEGLEVGHEHVPERELVGLPRRLLFSWERGRFRVLQLTWDKIQGRGVVWCVGHSLAAAWRPAVAWPGYGTTCMNVSE